VNRPNRPPIASTAIVVQAQRAPASPSEGFWTKVGLLVIDKVLLGAIVGIVAFWFNMYLQQQGKVADYQNKLFDRRADAYLDVLHKAQVVTDRLALLWLGREESGWTARLSKLEARWEAVATGSYSVESISFFSGAESVIPLLKDIELALTSNGVYFSKPVSDAVNDFLRTVYTDLEADLALAEQRKRAKDSGQAEPVAKFDEKNAWERTERAYQKLNDLIRARLRLDGIIIG
jgi:hypothetical protein